MLAHTHKSTAHSKHGGSSEEAQEQVSVLRNYDNIVERQQSLKMLNATKVSF